MLANMVCSLITERRITTTLAKARAARSVAEKMVTLGKNGTIHDRRIAAARLHQEDAVRILFNEIAPSQKERRGGYTRIIKMHQRQGDSAQLAILEWVDVPAKTTSAKKETATTTTNAATDAAAAPAAETKPAAEVKPAAEATKPAEEQK
jgi:large subunit ribosomal protein L17